MSLFSTLHLTIIIPQHLVSFPCFWKLPWIYVVGYKMTMFLYTHIHKLTLTLIQTLLHTHTFTSPIHLIKKVQKQCVQQKFLFSFINRVFSSVENINTPTLLHTCYHHCRLWHNAYTCLYPLRIVSFEKFFVLS